MWDPDLRLATSNPQPVTCNLVYMTVAAIEFVRVSHTMLGHPVLSELNLVVQRGETFALLGRSGCGKTTTLKLVNRLLDPSSGRVNVEGRSTRDWDPIRLGPDRCLHGVHRYGLYGYSQTGGGQRSAESLPSRQGGLSEAGFAVAGASGIQQYLRHHDPR